MLTIRDLKMSLGGRVLFEQASFGVNYGDRVALVGPNGAGKTTLFSIILKQKVPDTGTVERDEWTMVGYLPQEGEAHGGETILDVATGRVDELPQLEKRLLDHARPPGPVAGDGAGPPAAGRTDQPPRPALPALAAELPEELFRRPVADFA